MLEGVPGDGTLMTPAGYGAEDSRWDTYRNSAFAEIMAFYGITNWYTFQVSMLGLGPLFLGKNEDLKHRTAQLPADGAAHEIRMLAKLEGTVHVNMPLVVKFMQNYFFNPGQFETLPKRDDTANDDLLFNQGTGQGPVS
jgi:hypothetical protein